MSRRRKQQARSFEQRQAERKQRGRQRQLDESVEDMATKYNCSMESARDFADQCSERLTDLAYYLDCSRIARDMWSAEGPAHAAPLVDAVRALTAEHERHTAAITDLRRRMIELADNKAIHHHLDQKGLRAVCSKTLTYIQAPHEPWRKNHYVDVVNDMCGLGAPTIHAWWAGDHWRALEGSHRLAAAYALDLTPIIIEMSEDDEMDHDFVGAPGRRVADLLNYIRRDGPRYGFPNLRRGS